VTSHGHGGLLDGSENSWMSTAAADVPLQGLDDVGRGWTGVFLKQGDAAHDQAGGAVGALKRAGIEEGLLDGMKLAVLLEAFDGEDGFASGVTDGELAGTARRAIDQHRAGATLTFAAAVLGACETKLLAEDVE
jgi:hypothetical protein